MAARLSSFVQNCRKVVCVGRNYREHAVELGNKVPTSPLLFLKPPSSMVEQGGSIQVPRQCEELHHEVELAVVIGRGGRDIALEDAMGHIGGYALSLDMTARDLQEVAKKGGLPWSVAKGYDTFCPVGSFIGAANIPDPSNIRLRCWVDQVLRQDGHTKDMIFSVPYLIHHISQIFSLEEGDLILTGTPAGVGAVKPGQTIEV